MGPLGQLWLEWPDTRLYCFSHGHNDLAFENCLIEVFLQLAKALLLQQIEVIEESWGLYYQRFRGGVCAINQQAAS